MKKKSIIITETFVRSLFLQVEVHKKRFLLKANKLEEIFNDKNENASYEKGLSKGYSQGVLDTLRILGVI